MRKILLSALIAITAVSVSWSEYSDTYFGWGKAFQTFEDINTGLTVFPTLLIPLGGNLEGMGTAYTAVASDSGYLDSNPAGSATLATSELSFLHHNWIADSRIEGVVYTFRINDLGIGAGGKFLYVPFTEYGGWGERESKGLISETIGTLNASYNLFSNYHFYGLSVGANLKAAYRHSPAAIYPGQSAIAAMLDIGLLTRFNLAKFFYSRSKNFSVGTVLKNMGFATQGEPLPTLLSTGVAYSPIRPMIVAVDVNLPISFNPTEQPAEKWYIATGIDVNFTNFFSLQSGFQLKENPRISLGATVDLDEVSFIINYNLDLSGRVNPLDKFSVEAKLNLGDGGRLALQKRVDELYANGLEAYAQGDFEQAVRDWEEALKLNPKFLPARENLDTLKERIDLQKQIETRQQQEVES